MLAPRKMIHKEEINKLINKRYNNREISEASNISDETLRNIIKKI